ncbi:LEA type 2 family protein [Paraglaciecola sp. L1A13]|uniref:LEA type 2 family protein n=1 Tax=Paraglaciecola sp. L1A13 TaxID=2686359 RepID=UPI00131D7817|nr:LEA type 2 family protein [Paraglaciecola sp. L1A13]
MQLYSQTSSTWSKFNLLTLFFITLLLSSCATLAPDFEKPDLQLTNLQLLPSQGLEQRFRLKFRVVNPNNTAFPVDGMNFKLNLRGLQVATGVSDKKFVLQPLSEDTFEVDVSASIFNSGRLLLDIVNSQPEELAYEVNAKIFTSKGLWGSIPVTRSGVIPFGINKRSTNTKIDPL